MFRQMVKMLALIILLVGCKGQTKETMVREGISLMEQGNPLGAVVLFNNALEKDPNFVEARYQLGLAYQKSGKPEKAEKELQKVRLQDPDRVQVFLDLVAVHLAMKKIDEAETELNQFLEKNTKNSLSQEYRGRILAVRGDLPGSEEAFREAIELDAQNISARLALIQVYLQLSWTDEARSLLNSTLKNFPDDKRVYYMLAALETRQGNKKEALEAYRQVSRIDPNDVGALYLTGLFLLDVGDQDGARQLTDGLRKKFPTHPAGARLAGLISIAQGNFDNATIELRESLQGMPDVGGYYYLGLAEYRLGHYELALNQFQRALDIQAEHLPSRLMVAMTLLRQKRFDDSIVQVTKVLEKDSENAMAHNILGSAYVAKGEFDKGMEHLDRAGALDPSLADVHIKKGILNLSKGDQVSAEIELIKAVEVSPEILNSRFMLASLYLRQKNYSGAIQTLKDGLDGTERDAILYNFMAAAYFAQKQDELGIEVLQKAKKAKRDYFTPYFNLANYYISTSKRENAVKEYQEVLEIEPKQVKALISLATLQEIMGDDSAAKAGYNAARDTGSVDGFLAEAGYLLRSKNKSAASDVIDAAYDVYPTHASILEVRGKLLLEKDKLDEAVKMFQALEQVKPGAGLPLVVVAWLKAGAKDKAVGLAQQQIDSQPNTSYGYLLMASIHRYLGDIPQAEAVLKKGIVAAQKSPVLSFQLGTLYAGSGRTDQAIDVLSTLQKDNPNFVQATFALGTIYDQRGDKQKAAELYRAVLAKDAKNTAAMNNLAYLCAENQGTPEEGLDLAIKALRNEPTNPEIMDTLGYVLLKNGRIEEAVNILNRTAELLPEEAVVRLHQGQALLAAGKSVEARQALEAVLKLGDGTETDQASKLLQSIK